MSSSRFAGIDAGLLLLWLGLAHAISHSTSAFETVRFSNTSTFDKAPSSTSSTYPTTTVTWTEAPLSLTTTTIDIAPNVSVRWYGGEMPGTDLQAPGFVPILTRPTHLVTSYMSPIYQTFEYYTGPTTIEIRDNIITTEILTLEIHPENTVDLTKEWNGTQTTYIGPSYRDTTIVLSGPTSITTVAIVGQATLVSPPFALQTVGSLAKPSPTPPQPSPTMDPLPTSTDMGNALESKSALDVEGEETTEDSQSTHTTSETLVQTETSRSDSTPTIQETTATPEPSPASRSEEAAATEDLQGSSPAASALASSLPQNMIASETEQIDNTQSTPPENLGAGAEALPEIHTLTTPDPLNDVTAPSGIVTRTQSLDSVDSAGSEPIPAQATGTYPLPSIIFSGSNIAVSPIDSTRVLVGTVTASLDHNTIYISSAPIATLPAAGMSQISAYITSEAPIGSYIWQGLGGSPTAEGSAEGTRTSGSDSVAGETLDAAGSQVDSGTGPSATEIGQAIAAGSGHSIMANCDPLRGVTLGIASILFLWS